ncbi:hypothetical protein [Pseudomonas protegens]|uniref:Uncharacterized protein n=1 Tax=Pseudomonas protegens TaxID=380021 RepID=A0A9Q6IDU2_9PSED|nr:hypothetical protein [Pseudomonas protegens]PNG31560.1 hypothetical protein A1348_16575 [Pseudomonas protegens]PYC33851.1 hypothetical protein DMX08_19295 [Pseudomonas protegens]
MKNMTLSDWQNLLVEQISPEMCLDERYCDLICAANEMLRLGLVDRKEWHGQIQQAGDWLVAAIEQEQAQAGK